MNNLLANLEIIKELAQSILDEIAEAEAIASQKPNICSMVKGPKIPVIDIDIIYQRLKKTGKNKPLHP